MVNILMDMFIVILGINVIVIGAFFIFAGIDLLKEERS